MTEPRLRDHCGSRNARHMWNLGSCKVKVLEHTGISRSAISTTTPSRLRKSPVKRKSPGPRPPADYSGTVGFPTKKRALPDPERPSLHAIVQDTFDPNAQTLSISLHLEITSQSVNMASRQPPAGARGTNTRFAQFKLVLLGESAVGKSSIVLRFVKDQFDSYRESTIGAAFLTQTISLDENTTVKFEIWDTAGQERYKSLAPMYYRNANCAVVVYDITQSASLDKAKAWVKELQRQANENIVIALAGNKLDLVTEQPDKRAISTADAEAYAREAGLLFFETSAKTAENVQTLFTAIAKKLPLDQAGPRHARPGQRPGVSLAPENSNTNVSGPCSC
ncbi:unnamed protein product [Fusarium venenatum]|nr:uncharacterized protein FVRRES_00875 [Fusarium venenatum]CEI64363.1 unnamed protein product [Fusarium venenatum]